MCDFAATIFLPLTSTTLFTQHFPEPNAPAAGEPMDPSSRFPTPSTNAPLTPLSMRSSGGSPLSAPRPIAARPSCGHSWWSGVSNSAGWLSLRRIRRCGDAEMRRCWPKGLNGYFNPL